MPRIRNSFYLVATILTASVFCTGCNRPPAEARLQVGLIRNDVALVSQALKDGATHEGAFRREDLQRVARPEEMAEWEQSKRYADSPLVFAAYKGQTEIVRVLLEAGANPNGMTRSAGCGALHRAASSEVARLLLDHKADVNLRTIGHHSGFADGSTPLMVATKFELPAVVGVLLERGAHVNARDKDGFMAIHFVRPVRKDLRRLLVSHGADASDKAWPQTEDGRRIRKFWKDIAEQERKREAAGKSAG